VSKIKAALNWLLGIRTNDPTQYIVFPTDTPSWTEGDRVLLSSDLAVGCLNPVESAREVTIKQLKILLAAAPMMNAPEGDFDMRRINIAFVYIHPKTFAKLQATCGELSGPVRGKTTWVPISLMPEGRVIYSATPILEESSAQ
jgi:hypothetical protein